MDILKKELNAIYESQFLEQEHLCNDILTQAIANVGSYALINGGCCVITDASADKCHILGGGFCHLLGITEDYSMHAEVDSSDEDAIYTRLHPEDLVEKRMLEYEYFKYVDSLPGEEKLKYKATCTVRIRDFEGNYIRVANSTQVLTPSPAGKIWLILCCYDLAPLQESVSGISPRIVNNTTGEIITIFTEDRRKRILTEREKEILQLIRQGKPSKQIADILKISIHTVSRHRQNIIEKLSVGSTVEAIMAATTMKLL